MIQLRNSIGAPAPPHAFRGAHSNTKASLAGKTVMLLDGDSHLALHVVRCLGQVPGLRVVVGYRRGGMPARFSRHCANYRYANSSTNTIELGDVLNAVSDVTPDILMAVDESTIRLLSAHRAQLEPLVAPTPVPEVATFDMLTDKWHLAEFVAEHGLPAPTTMHFANLDLWRTRPQEHEFPLLIKPRRMRNGDGIVNFADMAALRAHMEQLDDHEVDELILQTYVPGDDVDCSVLCHEGDILAYTIQTGFIPRAGTYMAPAGIRFVYDEQVIAIVRKLVAVTGFNGVMHLDMRRSAVDGSVQIIEANLRYWASLVGSLTVGVNFPQLACLAALNQSFDRPRFATRKFVDTTAALRHWVRRDLDKPRQSYSYAETGIRFALRDPLAEMAKWVRRLIG